MAQDAVPEWQKLLALMLATIVVGALLVTIGPKLLGRASGPEGEAITQVKRIEGRGFEQDVAGIALKGKSLSYQRLQVTPRANGGALLTGTLDFTGTWGSTKLSSLGLERVEFSADMEPVHGWAPRLVAIATALEARRSGIEAGQYLPIDADDAVLWAQMKRRHYAADAWYVRSEREAVEVAEDYWLQGETPDRPYDVKATKRLLLIETDGGQFRFADAPEYATHPKAEGTD